MRWFPIILLVCLLWGNASSRDLEFFGYFEPQLMGAELSKEFVLLSTNKLRIDAEAEPMEGVKFGANVNFFNYNGKTVYNILDYLPSYLAASILPGTESYYELTYEDSIALDNVYARMAFRSADLTVGKQQISYGSGYAWNPTDVFNRKDILDPTYEQPGHNAVRIDVSVSRSFGLMSIYAPGEDWDTPTVLLRLKTQAGRFDLSCSALMTEWETVFYPAFEQSRQKRRMIGGDAAGEFLGLGIRVEGAYNDLETGDDFWEAVAGFDYTFRNELYVLGEFYYHSEAPGSSEEYTLLDWMHYFTGESRTVGRSQGYVFLQYPAGDLISVGGSVIGCINDESVALVPQIDYGLFQDVQLTAFGYFYLGEEGTMYSKDPGSGGLIRLRVYF